MNLLTAVISYVWSGVEGLASAPYRLRKAVQRDLRRWRRKQALHMVLTAVWPEGFDPKPVAQAILSARRVDLVGWMYDDRSIRVVPEHGRGVLLVHRGANGVYAVTDLTASEKH